MKSFIGSSIIKKATAFDEKRLNAVVDKFNEKLRQGKFTVNTGLDHVDTLNEVEFNMAKEQAKQNGYILSSNEDNYSTITYRLEYID